MTSSLVRRVAAHLEHTQAVADLTGLTDADLLARFRETRDTAALEAIIRRHGPRVLAACRGVLRERADVEDAFQATFVILLKRATTVRDDRALGAWLSGVAHRVSLRAEAARRRRARLEARAERPNQPAPDLLWTEACAILHQELDRLPEWHRQPLLLCYLHGLTRDETAAELGRTLASVKKSLERGREVLRKRLKKRGVTLSAGLLAAVVTSGTGLSLDLVRAAVGSVVTPGPAVSALARPAPAVPWKAAAAALAASVLVVGVALGMQKPETPPAAKPAAAAKAEPLPDVIKYAGTVTGRDGKPLKGAKLWLTLHGEAKLRPVGESGADGKFAFDLKRSELTPESYYEDGRRLWSVGTVLAQAPGHAIGWGHASVDPGYDIPVQLLADDVPIEGRIRNLEGQPVADATVRVVGLYRPKNDDLGRWYEDVKDGKLDQYLIYNHLITYEGDDLEDGKLDPLYPRVTTGKDGTFTLKGLGKERVARLRIQGDSIEAEDVLVMTRAADTVLVTARPAARDGMPRLVHGRYTVHGAKFDHTAAPSRPIAGIVTDLDTGKPIPGAIVTLQHNGPEPVRMTVHVQTRTDDKGRYELSGIPIREGCLVRVQGPPDQPYLAASLEVSLPPGGAPTRLDAKLKRGLWATVRVLDKTDKSPVTAHIQYFALADNPHLKDVVDIPRRPLQRVKLDSASYRIAVLPGPGIVAAKITWEHPFVSLVSRRAQPIATMPYGFRPQDYLGHVKINPAADATEVKCDIELTRGTDE
jgi:RNA polymerase sigma factor (sigma-70 family)